MRDIDYAPHIRGKPEIIILSSPHRMKNADVKCRSQCNLDLIYCSETEKLTSDITVPKGNEISKYTIEDICKCTLKIRGPTLNSRERRIYNSTL